jgi:cytochrome c553
MPHTTRFLLVIATVLPALFTLPVFAQQGPNPVPLDSMAERTRTCTACHGKEGRSTSEGYFPRIAGKPAGYLYNQLLNFRDGRRENAAMTYLVQHLSDAYLQEMAQYFASLDLPYPPPASPSAAPDAMLRGEALVRRGDAARRIPSCVQCHGDALTGVAPAMPGLLGLPRDYIVGQFGAWRTGQRRASAPDCMAEITARLAADDIAAVASWLSTQPLPADTRPAAAIALPLPMPCGSGPR